MIAPSRLGRPGSLNSAAPTAERFTVRAATPIKIRVFEIFESRAPSDKPRSSASITRREAIGESKLRVDKVEFGARARVANVYEREAFNWIPRKAGGG